MPRRSRHDDIWTVFQKYGGEMSLDRLTHYCRDEGVWTEQEWQHMAFVGAKRECHAVLSRKGMTGLPVAGPTANRDNGNKRWRQIELWDYTDAEYNLGMRLKQSSRDYQVIVAIHHYMQERYGTAPPIPHWVMDDPDSPTWWERWDDETEDDA